MEHFVHSNFCSCLDWFRLTLDAKQLFVAPWRKGKTKYGVDVIF